MEYSADRIQAFDPYIRIPGGPQGPDNQEDRSNTIRALLMDRAVQQARQILGAFRNGEFRDLPPVLRSLHRETRGGLSQTIMAMLAGFERFLTDDRHADVRERLDPVFRPIGDWVSGRYAITSPALLVIQSILYSHCEWFQDCLWEAHSAVRAYGELVHSDFPEAHCRFIAGILAHQTLARTAWSMDAKTGWPGGVRKPAASERKDPYETFPYFLDEDGLSFSNPSHEERPHKIAEAAAHAVAYTLFEFLASDKSSDNLEVSPHPSDELEVSPHRRRLAAALILHSLCLQARHHQSERSDIDQIKPQALRFFDYLIETPRDPAHLPGLVYIHYGRYVSRVQPKFFDAIGKHILKTLADDAVRDPLPHVTFCLPRVSSWNVWKALTFDGAHVFRMPNQHEPAAMAAQTNPDEKNNAVKHVNAAIRKVVGNVFTYCIDSTATGEAETQDDQPLPESLQCILGIRASDRIPMAPEAALHRLVALAREQHLSYWSALNISGDYYPAPLVGHVLHACRDYWPKAFTPLYVIAREPRTLTPDHADDFQFTVWLPKCGPHEGSHEDSNHSHTSDEGSVGLAPRTGRQQAEGVPVAVEPLHDENYDSLIAQYVAAMMIGVLVTYAPRRLVLDYANSETEGLWGPLIDDAFRTNGGPLMLRFAEQVCARRVQFESRGDSFPVGMDPQRRYWPQGKPKETHDPIDPIRILGIDAGGTAIKYGVFSVNWIDGIVSDPQPEELGDVSASEGPGIPWADVLKARQVSDEDAPENYPVRDQVIDLFLRTRQQLARAQENGILPYDDPPIAGAFPTTVDGKRKPIDAVGIAFPGPIADDVPVGISGVMADSKLGYTQSIAKGNSHVLHQVDFAQTARNVPGLGKATVVVLNDGDADILSSETGSQQDEGVHLVLKEGTGVAFAVFKDGAPVSRTAETAKAILNLRGYPDSGDPQFQNGAFGSFVSKKKIQTLLRDAISILTGAKQAKEANRRQLEKEFTSPAIDLLSRVFGDIAEQIRDPSAKRETFANRIKHRVENDLSLRRKRGSKSLARQVAESLKGIAESILNAPEGTTTLLKTCHDRARLVFLSRAAETQKQGLADWIPWLESQKEREEILRQLDIQQGEEGEQAREAEAPNLDEIKKHEALVKKCEALVKKYEALVKGCATLAVPQEWDRLQDDERYTIALAWVLGRWLADAIALSWDLYGMREVRLAGGPLSGAMGVYIVQSAREALSKVYGFDLGVGDCHGSAGGDWYSRTRRREIKALCLVDPPEDSSEGGPLGAAKAARDGYLMVLKRKQLRACREHARSMKTSFTVAKLKDKAQKGGDLGADPWVVSEEEIALMLECESGTLALTREPDGGFRPHPESDCGVKQASPKASAANPSSYPCPSVKSKSIASPGGWM